MLSIENVIQNKYPLWQQRSALIQKPALTLLKGLIHEREINAFFEKHPHSEGFDFLDRVLEYFNFSSRTSHQDRANIPSSGRVVIVSNHPLGSLDGLALLQLVGNIRRDVKIIANDLLNNLEPLRKLLLPIDNLSQKGYRQSMRHIMDALLEEEAVIVFPAGEVSRAGITGVKDGKWQTGFLHFARKTNSRILPIHIEGKNSWLFYGISMAYKPASMLMLPHEMFRQRNKELSIRIGQPISIMQLDQLPVNNAMKAKLLRKHIYRLGKGKKPLFETEHTIAHPQNRQELKRALQEATCLGETNDGKRILLYLYQPDSVVLRELGRLREEAFRQVGEGTGLRQDTDRYDRYYQHLILWDEDALEIAGAYRLGHVPDIAVRGEALYSAELFRYRPDMQSYFDEGVELGRSFVQPKYWGRRSLDYLWQGIGAYLRAHPEIRYLFGPVSLSSRYPLAARQLIVGYYRRYFADTEHLAMANAPFVIPAREQRQIDDLFDGLSADEGLMVLKEQLAHYNVTVPTLYKQYADVCDSGGVRFLDFGIDPDFGFCVDGLVLVDTQKLKPKKRLRYVGGEVATVECHLEKGEMPAGIV
ncbi:GNAT family N-acyltransferase [Pokkaliibacter sp. CJK22405]|uniref:GNAT family N-acyltransferase n=1 Tax=Pokkaliibacter sp. CJK22405 TaxID=3384615 RepID=UPI0039849A3D